MSAGGAAKAGTPEAFQQAFPVSRETLGKLETYAALLSSWQKTINLVAPATLPDLWSRHFADSAQVVALAPPGAKSWTDLGSGAGFPGLVVGIAGPDLGLAAKVGMVESDSRKAAFLREVARQTGCAVDIVCARIESPATHAKVGKSDVVSARALAPLDRLLELAYPFFASHSIGLFLKGREVEAEIATARARWSFDLDLVPSRTDTAGRVAVVRNLRVKSEG